MLDRFLSPKDINLLYEDVLRFGWTKGISKFFSYLPPEKFSLIEMIMHEKQAGWKFFLNLAGPKKVIIFDTTLGTITESIAPHAALIYCLHSDQMVLKCIRKRLMEKGLSNVNYIQISDILQIPFKDGFFDLVIMHDMEASISKLDMTSESFKDRFVFFLEEAKRVIRPSGSLFLSSYNRFSFNILWRKFIEKIEGNQTGNIKPYFLARTVIKYITKTGFNSVRMLCVNPSLLNIKEVIDPALFKRKIKLGSLRKIVKTLLFGNKSLTPAFIVIASRKACNSFLKDLLESEVLGKKSWKVEKYIIRDMQSMVIATSNGGKGDYDKIVIKLPLSQKSSKFSKQNMRNITKLSDRLSYSKVPIPLGEGIYNGQAYYIESLVKGITIDYHIDTFQHAFSSATDILIEFNRKTLAWCKLDDLSFKNMFSTYMDGLRDILKDENCFNINGLEEYLKKKLLGKNIPLVWQHGDFSFENLLIDPEHATINGIIDWDISEREGLPLIDLLHLIVSKRRIIEKREFMNCILDVIIKQKFDDMEKEALQKYLKALDIDNEVVPALIIMYWIHHITVRIRREYIKSYPPWVKLGILEPLKLINSLYIGYSNAR